MKLSFSTLGCPGWTFEEILKKGRACGFDGVGFRGIGTELDMGRIAQFAPERLGDTRRRLAHAGLATSMVLTSTKLIVPEHEVEANLRLAEQHIEIAAALRAPSIRVFGGQFPVGLSHAAAVTRAAQRLRRLGDHAAAFKVMVLLETHDDFTDPKLLRQVMEATDHPQVGVLWDIHHPFRILGQPVETAYAVLKPWIRSVDVKDSTPDAATRLGYRYVPLGEGDVPVGKALTLLAANGYDGWLTFEWEKRWHADLAEPEAAFPHFISAMRSLLAGVAGK